MGPRFRRGEFFLADQDFIGNREHKIIRFELGRNGAIWCYEGKARKRESEKAETGRKAFGAAHLVLISGLCGE